MRANSKSICVVAHFFLTLAATVRLANAQTVSVWLTTDNQRTKLQQQATVTFTTASGGSNPVFVDEGQAYQQVEGFGASFTDSAAYLLNQVATPSARTATMNDLFTRTGGGIGISLVRNPMGASDLARFHYSYDDLPPGQTDPALTLFSIAHDQADIIPLIQQARQLNPQLKIMATPWSPPGWMKSSGSRIGGALLPSMWALANKYPTKANYQTEHSGGTWVSDQVKADFEEITHVLRSWGRAYVKWSLALDQNRGPNAGGCDTCHGLVTVNNPSGVVSYNIDFYTLGHFSRTSFKVSL